MRGAVLCPARLRDAALRAWIVVAAGLMLLLALRPAHAIDPATLPEVGWHPGGIAYWDTPYFANALYNCGGWIEFAPSEWGSYVDIWQSPQFDANGFPQYLNPGHRLRAITYALHSEYGSARPAGWPSRSTLAQGRIVIEWQGAADIRPNGGTFVAADSNTGATGLAADGRRVYTFTGGNYLQWITVEDLDPNDPITDIKVWLPDPADPLNASLENQLFHPIYLERLADADWGFIRFMNWQDTNANPQVDWSDRRVPGHAFMTGALNPRPPATGSPGERGSGAALEHMIALCNAAGYDMWICVPHLANDDYIRKMAQTIRFGSDGANPYTSVQANPVYPPLDPSLRVYVEYSNEIWSSGYSFPQGDWAQEQATALGISKPQFNARRFCDVFHLFEQEFGGTSRLVRVGAVFTAADWYTTPFINEMVAYGATLVPPVEPDIIACTTYFSNGIQDYVFQRAQETVGTPDPWFMTGATFDAGGGNMHPVTLPASDPYWSSAAFDAHIDEAFDEWERRLLSGDAREGAGPDAVGIGGGFDTWLKELADTAWSTPKPLVAYEGGPSIYTDNYDWGASEDDGITIFMEAMNRRPRFADMYRMHLNMAKSKGLWSHVAFTDVSVYGKYGQWGHLEYLDQPIAESIKYSFLLDWISEASALRHVDDPLGAVPVFDNAHELPVGLAEQVYNTTVSASGGDGGVTLEVIASHLQPGLAISQTRRAPNEFDVTGTPLDSGISYVYARAVDGDGDAAWRTFTLPVFGGPDTLVESNLRGTDPGLNLPWTATWVLESGVAYSGIQAGAGAFTSAGDDGIVWSQNMPANEVDSTLALAVTDEEYLGITLSPPSGDVINLRGREVRFTIRRMSYHAPRYYSVMTSIDGFAAGSEIFQTTYDGNEEDAPYSFTFPDDPAYDGIAGPFEVRIYGHGGQYGGHETSLRAFKIYGTVGTTSAAVEEWKALEW